MKIDATSAPLPLGFAWSYDTDCTLDGRLLGRDDAGCAVWESALCGSGRKPHPPSLHVIPEPRKPADLLESRLARTLIRDFVPPLNHRISRAA